MPPDWEPSSTVGVQWAELRSRFPCRIQGGLADYNRAIQVNPNYIYAYINRGVLKYNRLRDRAGGVTDMQQAAKMSRVQNNRSTYQNAIGWLREWGASEGN